MQQIVYKEKNIPDQAILGLTNIEMALGLSPVSLTQRQREHYPRP